MSDPNANTAISNAVSVTFLAIVVIVMGAITIAAFLSFANPPSPTPTIGNSEATMNINESGNTHTITYRMSHGDNFFFSDKTILIQSNTGRLELKQLPLRNGKITDANIKADTNNWSRKGETVASGQIRNTEMKQGTSFTVKIYTKNPEGEFDNNAKICFSVNGKNQLFGCAGLKYT